MGTYIAIVSAGVNLLPNLLACFNTLKQQIGMPSSRKKGKSRRQPHPPSPPIWEPLVRVREQKVILDIRILGNFGLHT